MAHGAIKVGGGGTGLSELEDVERASAVCGAAVERRVVHEAFILK